MHAGVSATEAFTIAKLTTRASVAADLEALNQGPDPKVTETLEAAYILLAKLAKKRGQPSQVRPAGTTITSMAQAAGGSWLLSGHQGGIQSRMCSAQPCCVHVESVWGTSWTLNPTHPDSRV